MGDSFARDAVALLRTLGQQPIHGARRFDDGRVRRVLLGDRLRRGDEVLQFVRGEPDGLHRLAGASTERLGPRLTDARIADHRRRVAEVVADDRRTLGSLDDLLGEHVANRVGAIQGDGFAGRDTCSVLGLGELRDAGRRGAGLRGGQDVEEGEQRVRRGFLQPRGAFEDVAGRVGARDEIDAGKPRDVREVVDLGQLLGQVQRPLRLLVQRHRQPRDRLHEVGQVASEVVVDVADLAFRNRRWGGAIRGSVDNLRRLLVGEHLAPTLGPIEVERAEGIEHLGRDTSGLGRLIRVLPIESLRRGREGGDDRRPCLLLQLGGSGRGEGPDRLRLRDLELRIDDGPGRLGRRLGGDEGIREKRVVDGGHGLPHSPALDVALACSSASA